jgi:TRAP-type uncharacterized transport system fused permease subunit
VLIAAGFFGYLLRPASMWQRVALVAAALLLIKPGWITDLLGFGLAALVWSVQWAEGRRLASAAAGR